MKFIKAYLLSLESSFKKCKIFKSWGCVGEKVLHQLLLCFSNYSIRQFWSWKESQKLKKCLSYFWSYYNGKGSFNNYVDQILTNFDPPPSSGQAWTFYNPPPCPRGQKVEKSPPP